MLSKLPPNADAPAIRLALDPPDDTPIADKAPPPDEPDADNCPPPDDPAAVNATVPITFRRHQEAERVAGKEGEGGKGGKGGGGGQ